jgi:hypothetical protein
MKQREAAMIHQNPEHSIQPQQHKIANKTITTAQIFISHCTMLIHNETSLR